MKNTEIITPCTAIETRQVAPDWLGIGETLISAFCATCSRSANTIITYKKCARLAFQWLADTAADRVDSSTIRRFLDSLAGKAAATKQSYVQALRRVVEHARKRAACLDTITATMTNSAHFAVLFDPLAFDDLPKIEATTGHKRDALTVKQLKAVKASYSDACLRDRALIALMSALGSRCVEMTRLRLENVSVSNGLLSVGITHKGHTEPTQKFLPLDHEAAALLLELKSEREAAGATPNDFIFVSHRQKAESGAMTPRSIERIVSRGLKSAGVKSKTVTPHSIRHTVATIALEAADDRPQMLREVQRLYGHTSTTITERYTHDIDAKKAVVTKTVAAAESGAIRRGRPSGSKNKKKKTARKGKI